MEDCEELAGCAIRRVVKNGLVHTFPEDNIS